MILIMLSNGFRDNIIYMAISLWCYTIIILFLMAIMISVMILIIVRLRKRRFGRFHGGCRRVVADRSNAGQAGADSGSLVWVGRFYAPSLLICIGDSRWLRRWHRRLVPKPCDQLRPLVVIFLLETCTALHSCLLQQDIDTVNLRPP